MRILSDKILITRKKHKCSACGRFYEKGTIMRTQVNVYENVLNTWRECPTCQTLLLKYRDYFDDGYGFCESECVLNSLNTNQTPEQLLDYLEKNKNQ